jgi:hypothetical protein
MIRSLLILSIVIPECGDEMYAVLRATLLFRSDLVRKHRYNLVFEKLGILGIRICVSEFADLYR